MSTLDSREKAFEQKFAHDEELQFLVEARRNKFVGLWAAQQLGLAEQDATLYVRELQLSEVTSPGQDQLLNRVMTDFSAKGVEISRQDLQLILESEFIKAKKQFLSDA